MPSKYCASDVIDQVCDALDASEEEESSNGKTMVGKPPCTEPIEYATASRRANSNSEYQPSSDAESTNSEENFETLINVQQDDANEMAEVENPRTKKRCRWKSWTPQSWKKNQLKKARSSGQAFVNEKGVQKPAKCPKSIENHSHKEPTSYKCCSFSDEEKVRIYSEYWARSDYVSKKNFILKFTKAAVVKRRGIGGDENFKKNMVYEYFLPKQSENLKVCHDFFCKTLNISYKPIVKAHQSSSETGEFIGKDGRGTHEPHNKLPANVLKAIKDHIESFPMMDSHYCRKSSGRQYLSSRLSVAKMYDLFKETRPEKLVSFEKYKQVFGTEYNLAFHRPRKDQCATCALYNAIVNPSHEQRKDYEEHVLRKTASRTAMHNDIAHCAKDPEQVVATMDLQSVLQIPQAEASPFYYKRKLCVYNFTIYNEANRDGHCFLWSEIDGHRGSSEIGSCIKQFVEAEVAKGRKKIIFSSDNCTGQNRNKSIATLLMQLVKDQPVSFIEQNFLEVGHTQMDADSMHSAIEHSAKTCSVFCMNDWCNIIIKPDEKVHRLSYGSFYDLKSLASSLLKPTIRFDDDEKLNWLKIKSIRFSKNVMDGEPQMAVKYSHTEEFKMADASTRRQRGRPNTPWKPLYDSLLPISVAKKADLLSLCQQKLIPVEFHAWIQSLPTGETVVEAESSVSGDDNDDDEQRLALFKR